MNSLKNTIVAILLLGVSYGVYQVLTTAEPNALSTAEFHAASEPEIEIPDSPWDQAPPPPADDSDHWDLGAGRSPGKEPDAGSDLNSRGAPAAVPQFVAPPVSLPGSSTATANDRNNFGSDFPANPPASRPTTPSSPPAPWSQLPANDNVTPPVLGGAPTGNLSADKLAEKPATAGAAPLSGFASPAPAFTASKPNNSFPPTNPGVGIPQTPAAPFSSADSSLTRPASGAPAAETAAIPAQSSTGNVGLTSGIAPLPSLESSLQTARQLVAAGQMRQALAELSSQLHNPELEMLDQSTLFTWLDSLAGKVIYSTEHYLATQPHVVQPNETLAGLANAWQVPEKLVYNINRERIPNPFELAPGSELKKISGPFRAELDLKRQTLTLFLDELYAGRFRCVSLDNELTPGSWRIENKLESGHPSGQFFLQTNQANLSLHAQPADGQPQGCCFTQGDARDLFSILSIGSEIKVIR